MPIMASPDKTFYDSAESPPRKRKQDFQYPTHENTIQELTLPYYGSNQHAIDFNPNSDMQPSSDMSIWHHGQDSMVMHPNMLAATANSQQASNNYAYNQEAANNIIHHDENDGSVGENITTTNNRGLSEIHQLLNFDGFTTSSSMQPPPAAAAFHDFDVNEKASPMHLADLGVGHLQRQQLIQSWSNTNGYPNNGGNNSPGFFTPGFLESLQEDDSEPYHHSSATNNFPFDSNNNREHWQPSVEHDTIMMPSVSHQSNISNNTINDSSKNSNEFADLFGQAHHHHLHHQSTPPSPIPSTTMTMAASVAAGILSSSSISSTSSTSSPPPMSLTPAGSYFTPIAEENHYQNQRRHMMNIRLLQHAVNEAKMKPIIRNYLSNHYAQEERTVIILTSKVAQKSYGTEKRFLCPPPTAILVGTNWWTSARSIEDCNSNEVLKLQDGTELAPPKITVSISGETSTQSGQIEWYTVSGVTVGQTGHIKSHQQQTASPSSSSTTAASTVDQHPSRFRSSAESRHTSIDWYHNQQQELLAAGKCVSKHLYINDADEKRKRVEGLVRIQLANGIQLGTLISKGIKVISKPSKKRQSVKNMELCIHHGTTVSLFNRIRSQTVSTKYLGVSSSSSFSFPGQPFSGATLGEGTCFVARTTCWDPFVIWIVDTTRSPSDAQEGDTPEDFIGHGHTRNVPYPPPPAIALKNKTSQLIPIHYNQHVVLQCLTTGLVSPVMIIRKVDKASTVVGGACSSAAVDELPSIGSGGGGGEYGDEVLGDPVSQLHKVALQIVQDPQQKQQQHPPDYYYPSSSASMMPRTCQPVTYLACLNDMVGMHKTTEPRKPVVTAAKLTGNTHTNYEDTIDVTSQEGGKIVRKRRVSMDPSTDSSRLFEKPDLLSDPRRRINSLNDDFSFYSNVPAISRSQQQHEMSRKSSISSNGSTSSGRRGSIHNQALQALGAYWHEDVSDAAVWTIVGTDCATYTFLPPSDELHRDNNETPSPSNSTTTAATSTTTATSTSSLTAPFPTLLRYSIKPLLDDKQQLQLSLHGENFSRDLQVWFGDVKATGVEYRSRELILCRAPSSSELMAIRKLCNQVPILLVRGNGTVCKTNKMFDL